MARTNLKAHNKYEQIVLAYIEQNASDVLVEKINKGTKDLRQCMSFCKSLAKQQAVGGCAVIEDKEVYGWAMHFFEEDSIKSDATRPVYLTDPQTGEHKKAEPKPEPKPVPKQEPKKPDFEETINLMDWLGGNTDDE